MVNSWKTTVAGILQFLAITGPQINTLLDGDSSTNPDWNVVAASVAILAGLLFSKDDGK